MLKLGQIRRSALVALAALALLATPALAHSRHRTAWHHHQHHYAQRHHYAPVQPEGSNVAAARSRGLPWCGAAMADKLGIHGALGRELWLARNWASYGRATSAHVGAIVVWAHHVGQIVGREAGRWVVWSGNDGHQYRERPRSLAGAIAFRE